MKWHLAQVNIGRFLAPPDDPLIADFMDGLDEVNEVNAIADAAPGFRWRLQTEDGNATAIRPRRNRRADGHQHERLVLGRGPGRLRVPQGPSGLPAPPPGVVLAVKSHHQALWWVPPGTTPTVAEATARVALLDEHGPTADAFTFARRFAPPGSAAVVEADERDVCRA